MLEMSGEMKRRETVIEKGCKHMCKLVLTNTGLRDESDESLDSRVL